MCVHEKEYKCGNRETVGYKDVEPACRCPTVYLVSKDPDQNCDYASCETCGRREWTEKQRYSYDNATKSAGISLRPPQNPWPVIPMAELYTYQVGDIEVPLQDGSRLLVDGQRFHRKIGRLGQFFEDIVDPPETYPSDEEDEDPVPSNDKSQSQVQEKKHGEGGKSEKSGRKQGKGDGGAQQ